MTKLTTLFPLGIRSQCHFEFVLKITLFRNHLTFSSVKMSSITTQIHSLAAEVKERFRQMMDKIHEEAGTSSTGRVRLKTQLDKE